MQGLTKHEAQLLAGGPYVGAWERSGSQQIWRSAHLLRTEPLAPLAYTISRRNTTSWALSLAAGSTLAGAPMLTSAFLQASCRVHTSAFRQANSRSTPGAIQERPRSPV